jgi:hypothetical protein
MNSFSLQFFNLFLLSLFRGFVLLVNLSVSIEKFRFQIWCTFFVHFNELPLKRSTSKFWNNSYRHIHLVLRIISRFNSLLSNRPKILHHIIFVLIEVEHLFIGQQVFFVVILKSVTCWSATWWETKFIYDIFPHLFGSNIDRPSTVDNFLIQFIQIQFAPSDLWNFKVSNVSTVEELKEILLELNLFVFFVEKHFCAIYCEVNNLNKIYLGTSFH